MELGPSTWTPGPSAWAWPAHTCHLQQETILPHPLDLFHSSQVTSLTNSVILLIKHDKYDKSLTNTIRCRLRRDRHSCWLCPRWQHDGVRLEHDLHMPWRHWWITVTWCATPRVAADTGACRRGTGGWTGTCRGRVVAGGRTGTSGGRVIADGNTSDGQWLTPDHQTTWAPDVRLGPCEG
jgi:hypothetical protein